MTCPVLEIIYSQASSIQNFRIEFPLISRGKKKLPNASAVGCKIIYSEKSSMLNFQYPMLEYT